jgi:UDP-N-acetylglucosamine acyltransferase
MTDIHPTAIVDPKAELGANVKIGPYSVIGADVRLGDGVTLMSHVVVEGKTTIGPETKIFPFSSIGHQPQDLKFKGEASSLEIGARNVIREHVTMNDCLIMVGAHVAHDCLIGDNVILVNSATLGGHVVIEDWAIIGGLSAVHQFVRIGKHAMIGGKTGVEHDVIPYGIVTGNRARLEGLNIVGLKRRGFSRDLIHEIRKAYRMIFAEEGTMAERLQDVIEDFKNNEPVMEIVNFIRSDSSRRICQPHMEDAA